jgi:hypothetical protein
LSVYAPEYLEFSVCEDVMEGMDDVEGRPSLEGADMVVTAGRAVTVAGEERA